MRRGVFLVLALALAGCGGAKRSDYVSHNEEILASLPVFPRAVKAHEVSTPYDKSEGQLSGPSGYTTTAVYRLARGTSGDAVVRFYESRLGRRGWQPLRMGSTTAPVADFTRNGALVAVNSALGSSYELVVDSRGADR